MTIDLNCDLGEGALIDGAPVEPLIMPWITSVNIACGLHAGDALSIMKTIELALKHGVGIGAHPGYNDREEFGRRPIKISHDELRATTLYQVGAIKTMTGALGGKLRHIKAHGALYNALCSDYEMALVFTLAVKDVSESLIITGMPGSKLSKAAQDLEMVFAPEAFADRAYLDDGSLQPRSVPGAVIHDTNLMVRRVTEIVKNKTIETISGRKIRLSAETICIHGDNPDALAFLVALHKALKNEGIVLKPTAAK